MNQSRDKIRVKGIFQMRVYKKGILIEEYCDPNMIVDLGLNLIRDLISGAASEFIDTIGFGEGTSGPAAGDTDLTNKFDKAIGAVSYPSAGSVKWIWSLEEAEGNGMEITEFGLFADGTILFSRKTRAAISKDADIRLDGTWTINF
jgi:hypothetical protein